MKPTKSINENLSERKEKTSKLLGLESLDSRNEHHCLIDWVITHFLRTEVLFYLIYQYYVKARIVPNYAQLRETVLGTA